MKQVFIYKNGILQKICCIVNKLVCLLIVFVLVATTGLMAQTPTTVSKSTNTIQKSGAVIDSLSVNSVYQPVSLSPKTHIVDWAINIDETSVDGTRYAFYKLYLSSLAATYSLFVPTDEYFTKCIDPIAYGQDVQGVLKFWYNTRTAAVNATVYRYNKSTGVIGDSVALITNSAFLQNRLWKILDSHIVVGNVESGNNYYVTKANDIVKISGTGVSLNVQGGNDLVNNTVARTTDYYQQTNGSTYFLDKPIEPALKSVYNILSNTPQFYEFFTLLNGVPETSVQQVFAIQGVDSRVKFFNAYQYTVYVPTNDAIKTAIANNTIKNWATINAMPNGAPKTAEVDKLIRFLKYHFQDKAVFVGNQTLNGIYPTATLKTDNTVTRFGTAKNKFLKVGVAGGATGLTITAESGVTAHVIKSDGLYNIIAKDYVFAALPSKYKNVDGTGNLSGALFNTSLITSSSSTVIHQIDNLLTFE